MDHVPTYDKLFNPLLKALHELGGSASNQEIEDKVAEILKLSDQALNEMHGREGAGYRTKFSYRLAWARTYLKIRGLINNSTRGVWSLTPEGVRVLEVDSGEVVRIVRAEGHQTPDEDESADQADIDWQEVLLEQLRQLSPSSFERLTQRILREAGFVQVEVTGRSGDGGIDGRGVYKIGGLLSLHVIFQCKRYMGSVSSQQVRDFRGAMMGRTDKGLIITTGNFTRDARQEANRDGAPPVDLIDGDDLVQKMKELRLGVRVTTEEIVEIDSGWFSDLV
jgi:restriction system protein